MRVSIITTTYNAEKFIKKTIKSVINQSFTDYEYIIIDDCSKDNTIKIINELLVNDKIIFIKNEKNLGIVGSRNKALLLAKGEYICFLDHDDIWKDNNKLKKQVYHLDKNQNMGLVGTFVEYIDINDRIIGNFTYETIDEKIRNKILIYNQFCTCSVMFRKKLLDTVGLLNEKYNKVDDYDLWLKIGNISKLGNIPEYIVQYRKMDTNTSRSNINFFKMKFLHLKLVINNFNKYPNGLKAICFSIINLFIPIKFADFIKTILKKLVG